VLLHQQVLLQRLAKHFLHLFENESAFLSRLAPEHDGSVADGREEKPTSKESKT